MGGLIAQDGFDYQIADAIVRLPGWLCEPSFEGVIVEGLEDVEVRFFSPAAPQHHFVDRYQAKSAPPRRGQVEEVIERFHEFERSHPGVARVQTLVTPALPKELQWLARDMDRVQRARPFYAPFAGVVEASDNKLEEDITNAFGPALARTVIDSVEISLRPVSDREAAAALFATSLARAYPDFEPSNRQTAKAFSALFELLASTRGQFVHREALIACARGSLGAEFSPRRPLPLHIRSDRNAAAEHAIEIDASRFSNPAVVPAGDEWRHGVIEPLERTAAWAHAHNQHHVQLTGSYRLTTGLVAGWAFRSATGFDLRIRTRDGEWATNDYSAKHAPQPACIVAQPTELRGGRIGVSIGVLRDLMPDVQTFLGLANDASMVTIQVTAPITDGAMAQRVVQEIKAAVNSAVSRLKPTGIDLFYGGPAALALAIGHRWNAMPDTQVHEFVRGQGYFRSGELK